MIRFGRWRRGEELVVEEERPRGARAKKKKRLAESGARLWPSPGPGPGF